MAVCAEAIRHACSKLYLCSGTLKAIEGSSHYVCSRGTLKDVKVKDIGLPPVGGRGAG